MIYNEEQIGYLEEIKEVEWVAETISERFDNALDMLTDNSVVYGGAVRDILAGKELKGDLDIAILPEEFVSISKSFEQNPRWVSKEHRYDKNVLKVKSSKDIARNNAPMSSVTSFINMNGMVVQLITSNSNNTNRLQAVLNPAHMADIVCCCVVMFNDGRVAETVPGAYKDCLDGILRLNESSDAIYSEALPHRVKKLIGRGWKNTIDVESAVRDIELKQKRKSKTHKSSKFPWKFLSSTSQSDHKEYIFKFSGSDEEIPRGRCACMVDAPHQIGPPKKVVEILKGICQNRHFDARITVSPMHQIKYEVRNSAIAYNIGSDLHAHRKMSGARNSISNLYKYMSFTDIIKNRKG